MAGAKKYETTINKVNEILGDLKNKIYHPIYLLHGEEPYFIDIITNYIENNILSNEEKDFNQTVVYGKDTTVDNIHALARQYPMFSDHRVVIVKEAQDIKNITELKTYAQNPLNSTILVICHKYKNIDGRSELLKIVNKNSVLKSEKIAEYELTSWIQLYLKEQGLDYEYDVPNMLADYLGNNLHHIVNEIKKLRDNDKNLTKITKELVAKNIGISKEFNVIELNNAFAAHDTEKVFRILKVFEQNPKENPPQKVIPFLYSFFKNLFIIHYISKKSDADIATELGLNWYIVKSVYRPALTKYPPIKAFNIISLLREYDLKTKGVGSGATSPAEILRELAIKILA